MSTADWTAALDRMEHDLAVPDAAPWSPDQTLGPLPPHLEGRARAVAARQRVRIAEVAAELEAVRAQLQAARRIPQPHSDVAAYLDRNG